MPRGRVATWNKETVLEAIKAGTPPPSSTIRFYFGTLDRAYLAAGVPRVIRKAKPSNQHKWLKKGQRHVSGD